MVLATAQTLPAAAAAGETAYQKMTMRAHHQPRAIGRFGRDALRRGAGRTQSSRLPRAGIVSLTPTAIASVPPLPCAIHPRSVFVFRASSCYRRCSEGDAGERGASQLDGIYGVRLRGQFRAELDRPTSRIAGNLKQTKERPAALRSAPATTRIPRPPQSVLIPASGTGRRP
jgi:hypothetical protein